MMRGIMTGGLCLVLVAAGALAWGEEPPDQAAEQKKIEALIRHVAELKEGVFIRNGREYDAKTAAEFIRRKGEANRRKIKTAKDFIEHAASFSSTSGKPYFIRLKPGTEPVKSRDYLLEQLQQFEDEAQAKLGRAVLEQFLEHAKAGEDAKAARLTDPDKAVAKQVSDLRRIAGFAALRFVEFHTSSREMLAVTTALSNDRGEPGVLLFTARRQTDGLWLVVDIDVENADGLAEELRRFREDHPRAKQRVVARGDERQSRE